MFAAPCFCIKADSSRIPAPYLRRITYGVPDTVTSFSNTVPLIRAEQLNHIKYRPDIDGLRAIAVLIVLIFHAFPEWLPGGFIGVDIFFVISGYLITSILNKEMQEGRYSISEFYRRRIDRLFPALIVMLLAVYIFGWFTLFADEYMQLGKQTAGGAGFIANIVLFSETGYFNASAATKPLLHLWSLGIEEQFYILFPVILYVTFKLRAKPLLVILALLAVSFTLNLHSIKSDVERTFYLPQYRHWELLAGSFLALLSTSKNKSISHPVISFAMSFAGLALIGYSALNFSEGMAFPGWYAAVPVIGTSLIIGSDGAWINRKLLASKAMVMIGLISFPLYLWHWPLLSMAHIINGSVPPEWARWCLLGTSLILSIVTYLAIERPLKRARSWKRKTAPLLVIMAAIGIAGYLTYSHKGIAERANIQVSKDVSAQLNGALWQYTNNENCQSRYHFEPPKKLAYWFCMLTRNDEPEILLLGNSYANHLYPGVAESTILNHLNVLSIGVSDVTRGITPAVPEDEAGVAQTKFINNIIATTPRLKYVIISGLNPSPNQQYIDNLLKRIGFIRDQGKKVIIFAPHVLLKSNIKACFARPLKKPDCTTDLEEVTKIRKEFSRLVSSVSEKYPSVQYFDPNSLICDDKRCSSIRKGLPIYRDEYKHLSYFASLELGNIFAEWAKIHASDLTISVSPK